MVEGIMKIDTGAVAGISGPDFVQNDIRYEENNDHAEQGDDGVNFNPNRLQGLWHLPERAEKGFFVNIFSWPNIVVT